MKVAVRVDQFRSSDLGLLATLGFIYGVAFLFIKIGLESFSPLLFAAYRLDLAAFILFVFAFGLRKESLLPRGTRQWIGVGLAGLLMSATYQACVNWGQQYTTPAVAAVIVGLGPVLTMTFSRILLSEENLGLQGILGLGVGFTGIIVLAGLKPGHLWDARGLGELAVATGTAAYALGAVFVKRTSKGMDAFVFAAWQTAVEALFLHATSGVAEGFRAAQFDTSGVAALLYLAVFSSCLGFLIHFTLIHRVGPTRASLVNYVSPVFATLSGILVLHDAFEWRTVAAFLLILLGFLLVVRPSPTSKTIPVSSTLAIPTPVALGTQGEAPTKSVGEPADSGRPPKP